MNLAHLLIVLKESKSETLRLTKQLLCRNPHQQFPASCKLIKNNVMSCQAVQTHAEANRNSTKFVTSID